MARRAILSFFRRNNSARCTFLKRKKNSNNKAQPSMSATVQYMMRMLSNMSIIFLVLCAIGLWMKPQNPELGIYYFVAGLNLLVLIGSNLMLKFMVKSDKTFQKAMDKKQNRDEKKTISEWLKNH